MILCFISVEFYINIYMKCLVYGLFNCFDILKWIRKILFFYVSLKGENILYYFKNYKFFMGFDLFCVSNNWRVIFIIILICIFYDILYLIVKKEKLCR